MLQKNVNYRLTLKQLNKTKQHSFAKNPKNELHAKKHNTSYAQEEQDSAPPPPPPPPLWPSFPVPEKTKPISTAKIGAFLVKNKWVSLF